MKGRHRIGAVVCLLVMAGASGGGPAHTGTAPAAEPVYVLGLEPRTWAEADQAARAAGGRLAIVRDGATNARLLRAAQAAGVATAAPDGGGAAYVWLGASDAGREGRWQWADGRPLEGGFTAWGRGAMGREPDNYGGQQNYLALGLAAWPVGPPSGQGFGRAGEWNDLSGGNRLAWVAEFPAGADRDGDGMPDWKAFAAAQHGIVIPAESSGGPPA